MSWHDVTETPSVAIVNETFARTMWGETPAIGQRSYLAERHTEVVGVVEDGTYHDLMESTEAAVFLPLFPTPGDRRPRRAVAPGPQRAGDVVAAHAPRPSRIRLSRCRHGPTPSTTCSPARAATLALGVLGFLAVMLAMTGIFGMAAHTVSRRYEGARYPHGAGRGQDARHECGGRATRGAPRDRCGVGPAGGSLASRLLGPIVYQVRNSKRSRPCWSAWC